MQAFVVLTHRLEDSIRTNNIGVEERSRVADRIVIVAFGGKMHDDICFANEPIHQLGVANISFNKGDFILDGREITQIARICHLVDDGNVIFRSMTQCIMHEV